MLSAEIERTSRRAARERNLSGEVAFKLYDTYGFPLDLTQDVLRDDGIDVDVAGFERLMEEQRERGRSARKDDAVAPELKLGPGAASRFVGHRGYEARVARFVASGGDSERHASRSSPPKRPFIPKAAARSAIAA